MNKNYNCKHLTTTQRIVIEKGLLDGESFAAIARKIKNILALLQKKLKNIVIFLREMELKQSFHVPSKKTVRFASYVKERIALNSARAAIILPAKQTVKNFVLITL
ncbi:helix-turn-helix domain-containing protein [Clostridium sp. BL-8]|uniref:helix-turn-helix domain-containing protein n=1 Tax=Clostridium sp. BL-8 TaxID=349938 RepID=UPI001FA84E89|nr:helix-turn-helix domain-containing protein [Clostridium sp. BL-8]